MPETDFGVFVKRWIHWDGRGVLHVPVPHDDFDIPLVRDHEEEIYARCLGYLVHYLESELRLIDI